MLLLLMLLLLLLLLLLLGQPLCHTRCWVQRPNAGQRVERVADTHWSSTHPRTATTAAWPAANAAVAVTCIPVGKAVNPSCTSSGAARARQRPVPPPGLRAKSRRRI